MRHYLRFAIAFLLMFASIGAMAQQPVQKGHQAKPAVTHRQAPDKKAKAKPSVKLASVKPKAKPAPSPYVLTSESAPEECMAMTIYREARGESDKGAAGVGYVVMHRVQSGTFPSSICGTVTQAIRTKGQRPRACQFSWVCNPPEGKINQASYARAKRIASGVLDGSIDDPVPGALYFHEASVAGSPSRHAPYRQRIGNHVFYGPKPKPGRPQQDRLQPDVQPIEVAQANVDGMAAR